MNRKATCPAVLSFRIKQLGGGEIGRKKLLLVFYLLLVVSVSLVGISSAAIVYVPDNYSSIQEAINAASVDDTVIVRNGTYNENIVLNNSLSLIGEGYPSVDAQQKGSAIRITADGCVLKGFRCVNAKYRLNAGIRVDSDSNVIVNNSCEKNNYGICLDRLSSCNTIENNTCFENCEEGIHLSHSSNNTIENNTCFKNCEEGIHLSHSSNNTIENNTCFENCEEGIDLFYSSNNVITNNTCRKNNRAGIDLSRSMNNTITNNHFENCEEGIDLSHSSNNVITNNTCRKNNRAGIDLWRSMNNTITNNHFENCEEGIDLSYSSNNTITNNEIHENYENGIHLRGDSSNNSVYLNDFVNNSFNTNSDRADNIWNSPLKLIYVYNEKEYEGYMGNYWDDYRGKDEDGDGIGDTSYKINEPRDTAVEDDFDDYPLVQPLKDYF